MKATEFPRWVEQAREQGATHVEVRRARQNGGAAATLYFRDKLEGLDVERLLERMKEDITSRHRRLSRAAFDVLAVRVDGKDSTEVQRDSVTITRDDVEEASTSEPLTIEGASVEHTRVALAAAREAHRDLRDMAMGVCQTMQSVAESLSAKLVEAQSKAAEQLVTAFEFAQLKFEREAEANASSERRQLAKAALEELGPIAGAAIAHVQKNATPAWAALAKSLQTSGKLPKLLELLDPEEVAALQTALGFTFPDKPKKDGKANVESAG